MCSHFGPGRFLGELRPDLPEGCQEDAAGLRMLKPNQPCTLEALTALLASGGAEKPRRHAQQPGREEEIQHPWAWLAREALCPDEDKGTEWLALVALCQL